MQDFEGGSFISVTMAEENIFAIPDHDGIPMILRTDSMPWIQEIGYSSLIGDTESDTQAILGVTESEDGDVRRYSTGNVGIPYKSVKILSLYLAASRGSCHGRQDPEIKPMSSKLAVSYYHGSSILKPHCPEKNEIPSSTMKEANLSKQFSLPVKERGPISRPKLPKSTSFHINRGLRSKKDGENQENNEMSASLLGRTNETKKSILDEKNVSARSTGSSSAALHSVKKGLTRPTDSLAPKYPEKRVSRNGNSRTELNAKNKANCSSLSRNDKSLKHRQGTSPVQVSVPDKRLRPTIHGINVNPSLKSSENKSLRQRKQGVHVSKSPDAGAFSDYPDTYIRAANAKVEPRTRPRKNGIVSTRGPESTARKLSSRKGKVLEQRHVISSPRRPKFRRTHFSDSKICKAETAKSSLKKTKVDVDEGEINVEESESEKVIVKSEDLEEKKVEQNLLNEMIEETRNKLPESRKSKVKALAGAFETVISVQNQRPSSKVVEC